MPVFRWDRLWPGVPALAGDQGRLWSHHVLQLACHQDLSDAHLDRLVAALLRLFKSPAHPVLTCHDPLTNATPRTT